MILFLIKIIFYEINNIMERLGNITTEYIRRIQESDRSDEEQRQIIKNLLDIFFYYAEHANNISSSNESTRLSETRIYNEEYSKVYFSVISSQKIKYEGILNKKILNYMSEMIKSEESKIKEVEFIRAFDNKSEIASLTNFYQETIKDMNIELVIWLDNDKKLVEDISDAIETIKCSYKTKQNIYCIGEIPKILEENNLTYKFVKEDIEKDILGNKCIIHRNNTKLTSEKRANVFNLQDSLSFHKILVKNTFF